MILLNLKPGAAIQEREPLSLTKPAITNDWDELCVLALTILGPNDLFLKPVLSFNVSC